MNLRRILLIIARLLALAAVAGAMAVWAFLRSPGTPIERHYLPAYIWCSLPVLSPSNVEVQWIWKTGRHRKRRLATDDDAIDSGTGMALSPSALNAGWKALLVGPRQEVPADELRPYLTSLAFDGQSLWDLLLLPELSALAALCVALFTWFLVIGFLRALIAEYAWRQRLNSRQELLSTLLKDCTTLANRVGSRLEALYKSAAWPIELHRAATRTNIAPPQSPPRPVSFAFPVFGVHNGSGQGYLWSEEDEIE
jgi:hypothetical protein